MAAESVVDITGDLEIQEDGSLSIQTEMEPLAELTISTHGQGELVSGSVKVGADGVPSAGACALICPASGWPGWGPAHPSRMPFSRCAVRRKESTPGLRSTTWAKKR